MNEEALQLLYDEIASTFDVGSIEDFKNYLDDDNNRSSFYEEVIAPNYDVESLEDFESIYGLKKKKKKYTLKTLLRNYNWKLVDWSPKTVVLIH